jgi:hypothetical protein
MVIGKECSPGRGTHFARCHTDESPGHLLSSQTSHSRQLAALSDWTARKHLTRSARRADRRCPQPFVDGSSLPPAGQDDPGPGVRRPNPGSGWRAGTARATPRAASRPTPPTPEAPEPSPPGCAPVLRRPEKPEFTATSPHGEIAPRGNRLHYPRALVCRCQSTRPLQRWTPGKHTGVGAADRARRPLEPDLRATIAFRMDAEIPCGKGIFDKVRNPRVTPAGNPPWRAQRSRRH